MKNQFVSTILVTHCCVIPQKKYHTSQREPSTYQAPSWKQGLASAPHPPDREPGPRARPGPERCGRLAFRARARPVDALVLSSAVGGPQASPR